VFPPARPSTGRNPLGLTQQQVATRWAEESYRKREAEQTPKRKKDQNRGGDYAALLIDSVQNFAVLHERQHPEVCSCCKGSR